MCSPGNMFTSNMIQMERLYSGIYMCIHIHMPAITINGKEAMNLKESKKANVGGFEERKEKGEM